MNKFQIKNINRFLPSENLKWQNFIKKTDCGTLFHSSEFLSYHLKKFNEHHIGVFKGEELFGVMPVALIDNKGVLQAKSPYGASYGGFVFSHQPDYKDSRAIILELKNYLKDAGIKELIITPPIDIYYSKQVDNTFTFAMLEQGFKMVNSDIVSAVELKASDMIQDVFSSRAKRAIKKAEKEGLEVRFHAPLEDFWSTLIKTFEKHNSSPTHTFEQFKWLYDNLKDDVWCDVAYHEGTPIAGIGHFRINKFVDSSFYICNDEAYKEKQALSWLIARVLEESKKSNFSWFDFGTSSVNMVARENIFEFKENFGSIGVFRNTYKLEL